MALEGRATSRPGTRLRATFVARRADTQGQDDTAAKRAGVGRYAAVLSLRQRGRRAGRECAAGSATTAGATPCRLGRCYACIAREQSVARIRLPLPADELAAGVQD